MRPLDALMAMVPRFFASAVSDAGEPDSFLQPRRARRIVIAEDERIVALDLCATLEDLGYEVVGMAASAAEACSVVKAQRPDLILMDVRLSGDVDGIQAAAFLRSQLDVAVVFLTANADSETLRRALLTTPSGFLAKPYDERTLHSTIQVALAKQSEERALSLENHALRRESLVDPLTGLYNRRHLTDELDRELEFARRENHPVGVILLDLDHFELINDRHGHAAGDAVLRGVAHVLRGRVRSYDTVCRYGGEEMLVLVPGTSAADACAAAEVLRQAIAKAPFRDSERNLPSVTASFGVAAFPEHARAPGELLRAADQALAQAKDGGRNRVVVFATP